MCSIGCMTLVLGQVCDLILINGPNEMFISFFYLSVHVLD